MTDGNKYTAKKVKHDIIDNDGVHTGMYAILDEDIPEEYREEFDKWMYGQTVPMIPHPETGQLVQAVYWHDWIRWYQFKTGKAKFLIFD